MPGRLASKPEEIVDAAVLETIVDLEDGSRGVYLVAEHEGTIVGHAFLERLLLAATALGLGSALTTITTLFADDMRQLLGLPEHLQPIAVVPLGWPAKPLGPPRRDPFADHTHRDRYGTAW